MGQFVLLNGVKYVFGCSAGCHMPPSLGLGTWNPIRCFAKLTKPDLTLQKSSWWEAASIVDSYLI